MRPSYHWPDREEQPVGRADHITKLYAALAEPCLRESQVAVPFQQLLDQLNQGAAPYRHEAVEGPHGVVYTDAVAPKVVVVVSATGGVGRSTLAAALASGLQRQGNPALALELDPQNALRHHLCPGFDVPGLGATSLLNQTWQALPKRGFAGCRLVTFGETDAVQQQSLNRWLGQDQAFLAKRLAGLGLSASDTVVIDVPAGNTVYLSQALSVADVVLVVVQPDAASFRRLAKMDEVLAPYLAGAAPPLRFYVINQVDAGQSFSEDMAGVFKLRLGEAVLGTVQRDVSVSEAQAYGRDPFDPALNSGGSQDVSALCQALSVRMHLSSNGH